MVKIEVFTSPTCPHCPAAKKIAQKVASNREDVKVVETSTYTKDGQHRAREFDVRSVPTLFVTSQDNPDRIAFVGVPGENQLNRMIDISLGKEEWPKQEGMMDKIKSMFSKKSTE
jgi:small redox-active disulfide protein 1